MTKPKLPPGARQRPDGRYEQRLTLDGTRISVYALTPKELRAKVDEARDRHAQGVAVRTNETVEAYLRRWLRDVVKPHRTYHTYVMHRVSIERHLIPALGSIRLDRLTVSDVRIFLNSLLTTPKMIATGAYKPGTINVIRATLVAALNEAMNEDLIAKNVAARVPKMQGVAPHRPPFSRAQAERFLAAVRGDRLEALYRVALVCGLRINEALGLTWDRVNLETGVTRIDRQLQREPGRFSLPPLKNRASLRTLTLPAMARHALIAHRAAQDVERARTPIWGNTWALVFTASKGQPLYDTSIRKQFSRYCVEAGLPHASPHDLRHTAASLLAAQGVPDVEIAALLGHANTTTTRLTYTHAYDAGKERVAGTMNALFPEPSG